MPPAVTSEVYLADESLGLTLLEDYEANDAQVSYFKRFGGPPDGKEHFVFLWFFVRIDPCGNH